MSRHIENAMRVALADIATRRLSPTVREGLETAVKLASEAPGASVIALACLLAVILEHLNLSESAR